MMENKVTTEVFNSIFNESPITKETAHSLGDITEYWVHFVDYIEN